MSTDNAKIEGGQHITLSADEQEEAIEIRNEQEAMKSIPPEHITVITPEMARDWGMELVEAEKNGAMSDGSGWSAGDIDGMVAGAARGQG